MSRTFEVWLDSGANSQSEYRDTVTLDYLNISEEEWDSMSEDERNEVMREVAWFRMDWGYREVES